MPPGPSSNPPLDARSLRGTSRPAICSQALLRLRPTPTRITHPTPGDARARCHQVRARQGAQASAPPNPALLASIPLKAIITLRLVCRIRRAEHIYGFGSSKRRPRYNLFYSTVGFRPIWLFADAAYKSLANSLFNHHSLVCTRRELDRQGGRWQRDGRGEAGVTGDSSCRSIGGGGGRRTRPLLVVLVRQDTLLSTLALGARVHFSLGRLLNSRSREWPGTGWEGTGGFGNGLALPGNARVSSDAQCLQTIDKECRGRVVCAEVCSAQALTRPASCAEMFAANKQTTTKLWMWRMEYLHHEQRPLYFGEWF